jgi:hypothetical protein
MGEQKFLDEDIMGGEAPVRYSIRLSGDELVSMLYRNSVHHHACTALVSTHDTSESEDSGATDKCPVLAQHAEQEAFSSTTSVLPLHGVLAGNPGHSVGKVSCRRTVSLYAGRRVP